jgi:glyoxylase-like metal-dependent hydrolase (beta-lactamase superfamily II)
VGAVTGWQEVADRIWVRRYEPFDVNVTVVAGGHGALLIDTRTTLVEATEVREQLRELPIGPLTALVLTHAHLDHCLGAGAFGELPVYASAGCREQLQRHGISQRERWLEWLPEERHADLRASPLPVPDRTVTDRRRLDLGDRDVDLAVLGRGHTDHDLIAHVPDASTVLAGDLVEVGGPPQFHDAYPFEWAPTLSRLEAFGATVTVPGHGAPADGAVVAGQREDLAHLAALCREVLGGIRGRRSAVAASPFPEATTTVALDRAAATRDAPAV